MLINNKRALAYIQTVHDIEPIDGADNIELVHVLGWTLIARKGEFHNGDACVYIEIDSHCPQNNPAFEFLAAKEYKVKTMKLSKFGVVSQGLALPLNAFPMLPKNIALDADVTDILQITNSATEEDTTIQNKVSKFLTFQTKHPKFFHFKIVKVLMRHKWFKTLLMKIFIHRSSPDFYAFPTFISKTNEERVQNLPKLLKNKKPFIVTEKIDGSSTTWSMVKNKDTFDFYVCSHGMRIPRPKNLQESVFWEMATQYDIESKFKEFLAASGLKSITIQGESYGAGIQQNPYKMKEHHFAAFNCIWDNKKLNSIDGAKQAAVFGIPWVPIIYTDYILPDTVEEVLQFATGKSAINNAVLREGYVIRSLDNKISFKVVSPDYLLKHNQ